MCGILIVVRKNDSPLKEEAPSLHRALSNLRFRGPDYEFETYPHERLYFGQTVLSLTGEFNKPSGDYLKSKSKRYQLAFNGEIYNYRAIKDKYQKLLFNMPDSKLTDSEVLVNLFDTLDSKEIADEIDGMYAYVVYDQKDRSIQISRDPQGEKTLYIFEDDKDIIIASDIKTILALRPSIKLNLNELKDYFSTRHMMSVGRTHFNGISQILPGQTLSFSLDSSKWLTTNHLKVNSWIDPDRYYQNDKRSIEDLTDELDAILTESFKEMIPTDREFASVLSGGVDSSLLSAYAVEFGNPKTLVAVNHIGKEQISHDLIAFEKILNKKVNVVNVDAITYAGSIPKCQNALSGPIYSHSFVGQALQSQYVRGLGCKAMFGGEGADELFGGYSCYLDSYRRNINLPFSMSPYSTFSPSIKFDGYEHDEIKSELETIWQKALQAYSFVEDESERAAHAMMNCDLVHQVPAVGLRGADLMSMMWSIETRSVFLRRKLIKFGINLPMKFKADNLETDDVFKTKKILKKLFVKKYNKDLLFKKQGFSGFPNESGAFLGDEKYFITPDILKISKNELLNLDRSTEWKLINMEYFLRNFSKYIP